MALRLTLRAISRPARQLSCSLSLINNYYHVIPCQNFSTVRNNISFGQVSDHVNGIRSSWPKRGQIVNVTTKTMRELNRYTPQPRSMSTEHLNTSQTRELTGHVAVVTGGSRGIGLAVCRELLQAGASVIMVSRNRDSCVRGLAELMRSSADASLTNPSSMVMPIGDLAQEAAKEVGFEFPSSSQKLIGYSCDVSDPKDVAELFKQIPVSVLGSKATMLICCAGVLNEGLLVRLDEAKCSDMLNINVLGPLTCTKAFLRQVPATKEAEATLGENPFRVVYVGSVVGTIGQPGVSAYAASKSALVGLTKSLAKEYAGRGVTINMVAPGYIDTDMTKHLSESRRHELLQSIPLKRIGRPQDVAHSIRFLLGPWSRYITGQRIAVDGGMS